MKGRLNSLKSQQTTEKKTVYFLLRYALPTTVGLLAVAMYSLADAYFVSGLGESARAAVAVAFPVHVILQAVGYTLGMGAGSLLSRALGGGKPEKAGLYAKIALFGALGVGLFLLIGGTLFCDALVVFLGASEQTAPLAVPYVRYLLYAAPVMCGGFVLSQLLRAEGRTVWSMAGLLSGSVCNILLDAWFIRVLEWGVSGASLATLCGQSVGLVVFLLPYLFRKTRVRLTGGEKCSFRSVCAVLYAGLPSLFRQGLSGTAAVLTNRAARAFSDGAVAALATVNRIFLLVFSLCLGIGQGMMPLIGYSFGAGDHATVKRIYRFSVLLSSAIMLLCGGVLFASAPTVIGWFLRDAEAISLGVFALRAQSAVLVLHGALTCSILYFQATGHPLRSSLLACARQGIFFLPLFFLWGRTKIRSLLLVQAVADVFSFLLTVALFPKKSRRKV